MQKEVNYYTERGHELTVTRDDPAEYGQYLYACRPDGGGMAVFGNTPKLRRFLRIALARLERDAPRARRDAREDKKRKS